MSAVDGYFASRRSRPRPTIVLVDSDRRPPLLGMQQGVSQGKGVTGSRREFGMVEPGAC